VENGELLEVVRGAVNGGVADFFEVGARWQGGAHDRARAARRAGHQGQGAHGR